jgi:hypothetical protein
VSGRLPTAQDAEAIGAKLPQYIEKAPYVREKLTGMIHFWQDWMHNMGDVLEPCWDPPDAPKLIVATSPLDIAHYGSPAPQQPAAATPNATPQASPVLPASEQSAGSSRKGQKREAGSRQTSSNGNAR